ncbi:MAG: N-acetylmuramic acid 6-phosphate etherase [Phycisphaerales bacterium]|nr:N-acetylmuramic acid 6-phosphate etherase [Phycisphaerales bacterium]
MTRDVAKQLADRGHLLTEQRLDASMELDARTTREIVSLINEQDATVAGAVARAGETIAGFVDAALAGMRRGGRLIYVGAGTSGRLGVLDASECPPTFQTPPEMVVGLIAGGDAAMRRSSEWREDEHDGAHEALRSLGVCADDAVLGITTGGTTPYVRGAVEFAAERDATTGMLVCARVEAPAGCGHMIFVETGAEVVTGSTRMKAGTATKMVLNTISTTLMVRLGKVHGNLMVDLRATNAKLRDRGARIVAELTGAGREVSIGLLDDAGGEVKTAVVMERLGVDAATARRMLVGAGGSLRAALEHGDDR